MNVEQDSSSQKNKITQGPLNGRSIVITRPAHQSSEFSLQISHLGGQPWFVPVVEIVLTPESEYRSTFRDLSGYDWIVFTSVNGVRAVASILLEQRRSIIKKVRFAAIGPATAGELSSLGIEVQVVPEQFISDAITEKMGRLHGMKVLIPRASVARRELIDQLIAAGASPVEVPVYSSRVNRTAELLAFLRQKIESGSVPDYVTFTSSSTVKFLCELLRELNGECWLEHSTLCCIGPVTASTLVGLGYNPDVVAEEYSGNGLLRAIVKHASANNLDRS